MAKQWQIRRGTTQENEEFIGALAEVTYDTEKKTVRVHDGVTAGGTELAKSEHLYHPNLFDVKWADHILNDIQWLRADTFSWQSGEVYEAAYNHLNNEYTPEELATITVNDKIYTRSAEDDDLNAIHPYCWKNEELSTNIRIYTTNEEPEVGDFTFGTSTAVVEDSPITALGTVTILSTETIANITISYYRTADKHKIVLPDQELNVEAIYEATGVAWYYILDTENQRFKLPRTKYGITGLRNNAGDYVEPGLPNITGGFGQLSSDTVGGAFYRSNDYSNSEMGGSTTDHAVNFDASRSSSIYGSSDTVQPAATEMYLYFYMGEFPNILNENVANILSLIYPIGSLYMGTQAICPMTVAMPNSTWELVSAGKALWTGNGTSGSGTTSNENYANAPANTTISAGLPDHVHTYNFPGVVEGGSPGDTDWRRTGATTGMETNGVKNTSIYGKSSTVQPPAYVVNVWKRTA